VKLELDKNLGRRTATMLRTAGFDVATVPEEGLCSASDQQLLEICRQEGRCLVTLDLGFGNPLRFPPASYPGIAVPQLPPPLSHTHEARWERSRRRCSSERWRASSGSYRWAVFGSTSKSGPQSTASKPSSRRRQEGLPPRARS
jgi:hypothetical protein